MCQGLTVFATSSLGAVGGGFISDGSCCFRSTLGVCPGVAFVVTSGIRVCKDFYSTTLVPGSWAFSVVRPKSFVQIGRPAYDVLEWNQVLVPSELRHIYYVYTWYIYINKTINSFSLVGRRGCVSVAFRKIVNPDSRELCTIREWRDFSGTDSTGLPLISAALARRDRL